MQPLKVRILSEEYALRTEDPELTCAAVAEVNRLIGEYRQKISDYSPVRLAVLAATSLAEKVLEHEQRLCALQKELERLNHYITNYIEAIRSDTEPTDSIRLSHCESDLVSMMPHAQHPSVDADTSPSA